MLIHKNIQSVLLRAESKSVDLLDSQFWDFGISFCFGYSSHLKNVYLVFLIKRLREMTIPASSWIQLRASCCKGQICSLWCFDMQTMPALLGCDPLFCQQLMAMIAVTELCWSTQSRN